MFDEKFPATVGVRGLSGEIVVDGARVLGFRNLTTSETPVDAVKQSPTAEVRPISKDHSDPKTGS